MAKRDFNFKGILKNILKTKSIKLVFKLLNDFEYQVRKQYSDQMNKFRDTDPQKERKIYDKLQQANNNYFPEIRRYYTNLHKRINNDTIPDNILNYKYFNLNIGRIKGYIKRDQLKEEYYDWLHFINQLHNNCPLLFNNPINHGTFREVNNFLNIEKDRIRNEQEVEEKSKMTDSDKMESNNTNLKDKDGSKIVINYKSIVRKMNDGITSLTENQTILLFTMLQSQNIFRSTDNHGERTNYGKALEVLTGYNAEEIRKKLSQIKNSSKSTQNDKQENFSYNDYSEVIKKLEKALEKLKSYKEK
jgi:hypothetical protein